MLLDMLDQAHRLLPVAASEAERKFHQVPRGAGFAGFLRRSAAAIDVFQCPRQIVFRLRQRGVRLETFIRLGEAGPVDNRLGELAQGRPHAERRGTIIGRD